MNGRGGGSSAGGLSVISTPGNATTKGSPNASAAGSTPGLGKRGGGGGGGGGGGSNNKAGGQPQQNTNNLTVTSANKGSGSGGGSGGNTSVDTSDGRRKSFLTASSQSTLTLTTKPHGGLSSHVSSSLRSQMTRKNRSHNKGSGQQTETEDTRIRIGGKDVTPKRLITSRLGGNVGLSGESPTPTSSMSDFLRGAGESSILVSGVSQRSQSSLDGGSTVLSGGSETPDTGVDNLSDLDYGVSIGGGSVGLLDGKDKEGEAGVGGVGIAGGDLKDQPHMWTQEELEEPITVEIRETETFTLLHIPGLCVWQEDDKLHKTVTNKNEKYSMLLRDRVGKDIYVARLAQTFNYPVKDKKEQAAPPATRESGCMASTWDIFDSQQAMLGAGGEGGPVDQAQKDREAMAHLTSLKDAEAKAKAAAAAAAQQAASSLDEEEIGEIGDSANGGSSEQQQTPAPRQSLATSTSMLGFGGPPQSASALRSSASFGHSERGITESVASSNGSQAADGGLSTFVFKGGAGKKKHIIMKLSSFKRALTVLERAITQNELHERHLLYRNMDAQMEQAGITLASIAAKAQEDLTKGDGSKDDDSKDDHMHSLLHPSHSHPSIGTGTGPDGSSPVISGSGIGAVSQEPALTHLWSFECEQTQDRSVSCMDWNKLNKDVLATAYGEFEFGLGARHRDGLIALWTLKNPKYPDKIIQTRHGVTVVDFCTEHPHLLAAGLYDGSVSIYDVREAGSKPALESAHATGKHSETVWGLKWVNKGGERGQHLTSIATDGTVKQWSMKKGLVPSTIMLLKRIPNHAQAQGAKLDGIISRTASGMCFDFPINDNTQYLAGTEDGIIHKCSVSYNEQVLENYFGHTGPVYKLRCSPFLSDAFLSCSADWTCKLWSQSTPKPIISFQSGHDYVMDLAWSPSNACVFGSVSRDGRIEVWDLEQSTLDPYIKYQIENRTFSCILFGQNAPVILAGSTSGSADLFRLHGILDKKGWTAKQQADSLKKAMYADKEHNHLAGLDKKQD